MSKVKLEIIGCVKNPKSSCTQSIRSGLSRLSPDNKGTVIGTDNVMMLLTVMFFYVHTKVAGS